MRGVRIASSSTTTSSTVAAALLPANPTGITFGAALANLSEKTDTENGPTGGGSRTHSDAGAASRLARLQEKAQSSSVVSDASALTTATIPPTDPPAALAADKSSGQGDGNRTSDGSSGFSGTLTQASEVPAATAAHVVPQPLLASQLVTGPAEPNATEADSAGRDATTMKQLNPVPPSDGSVTDQVHVVAPATANGTPQADLGIAVQVAAENFNVPMELPMVTTSSSNGDRTQSVSKADAKGPVNASGAKNPSLVSTTDTGKSKAEDAVATVSDGSSHIGQNNGQSTQHSQTDTSQAAAVAAKGMDSGTSQAQTIVMHAVSNETATALRSASGAEHAAGQSLQQSDPVAKDLDGVDAATTPGINAAKVIQTMSQTGMSVGMHSSEFGNISIRTSVSQQQMLAQISLDHGDLSQVLSSHIASVQTKLENDSGLHTVIEVNHQGAASSGDSGNSAQREQKEFVRSGSTSSAAIAAEPEMNLVPAALVSASNRSRLDVRA